MNIFDAGILGIVEGITEFLPISSTAHMILAAQILGLAQTDFLKSFEIIIQLGAILAVLTIYFKKFFDIEILKKVIAGFIPTGILGLVFYKIVKQYFGDTSVVLWALLVGGIVMIVFEKFHTLRLSTGTSLDGGSSDDLPLRGAPSVDGRGVWQNLTIKDCVKVGLFQSISFIPGVSRSAATILGGMFLGISRSAIVEYSFLLAVPTMLAATGLDAFKNRDLIMHSGNVSALLVGLIVSYFVALLAIKFFLSYIKKHDFVPFGVYRILIAILGFMFLV